MTRFSGRIRWGVERRLEFIEFRLFWDGQVNRGDLVEFFSISVPQASADLNHYQELAETNMAYDKRARAYRPTSTFDPAILKPTARQYLAQLRGIADGAFTREESWFGWLPPFDVVPLVRRRLDAGKLRDVLAAIHTSAALHIEYQSASQPNPRWRWITPHAIAFDGFRWHVRAWCHDHQDFRDFVFARVLNVAERQPSHVDAVDDVEWHTEITMRLGPHPLMAESVRRVMELDYGMVSGAIEVPTRVCLSFYLERQLGLDLSSRELPPGRQQLVLLNRREVEAAREAARNRKGHQIQN